MTENDDCDNFSIKSYEVSPVEFNQTFKNECLKSFTSHINIRSLNKNVDKLRLFYEECIESNLNIIGISEVWNVSSLEHVEGLGIMDMIKEV